MRLIDADALKAHFEEDGHLSGYIEEFIDACPTVAIGCNCGCNWISVEDRLPPNQGKKVLVVNGHGYVNVLALWKKEFGNKWTWIDERGHFKHTNDITHWMPLPEPPKGE